MKRLVIPAMLMTTSAFAQSPLPPDPATAVCQQLLAGANDQTIRVAVQAQGLAKDLQAARDELAKLKKPPDEPGEKPKQ